MSDRIDVLLRLQNARKFQAEAKSSAKAIDKIGDEAAQTGRQARSAGLGLAKFAAAGAAVFAAGGAALAFLKSSISTTMSLAKSTRLLQRTTGLDAEAASAWVATAKARGIETTKLNRSFIGLAKQMRSASQGSATAVSTFKDLGIAQDVIKRGNFAEVIGKVSDAFAKMPDGPRKAAIAQQLFGRQAAALLPLLNRGSKGIAQQRKLAKELGATLDSDGVKNTMKLRDAQIKWNLSMMGLKNTLGRAVMPALAKGALAVTGFVHEMRTGKGDGGRFAETLKSIATPLIAVVKGVSSFASKHPEVARLATALLAVGIALKAVTFASQITGISRVLSLTMKLGSYGVRGGMALADGIAGAFFPQWSKKTGGIRSVMSRTFRSAGSSAGTSAGSAASSSLASRFGSTIGAKLKSAAGSVMSLSGVALGTVFGSAIASTAYAFILNEIGNWTFNVVGGTTGAPGGNRDAPRSDDPTGVKQAWDKVIGIFGHASTASGRAPTIPMGSAPTIPSVGTPLASIPGALPAYPTERTGDNVLSVLAAALAQPVRVPVYLDGRVIAEAVGARVADAGARA